MFNRNFSIIITFIFIIHMVINLERLILLNELLVVISTIILFINSWVLKDWVFKALLVWILYGLLRLIFSLVYEDVGDVYQIVRTLPIWYSPLVFLFGYFVLYEGWFYFKNNKLYSITFIAMAFILGYKLSTSVIVAILSKRRYLIFIFPLFFLVKNIILGTDGNSTIILMVAFIVLFSVSNVNFFKLFRFTFDPIALIFIVILSGYLLSLFSVSHQYFYSIGYDYWDYTDANIIWRLMFWAYEMERLFEYSPVFGIGLGTPLFDRYNSDVLFIISSSPQDEQTQFTLGLHNSFLTVFTRLGMVGVILFSLIVGPVLKNAISKVASSNIDPMLLLGTILMLIAAGFHVILESPLYSGIFWALLGLCHRFYNVER